jgi:hypothetical protein
MPEIRPLTLIGDELLAVVPVVDDVFVVLAVVAALVVGVVVPTEVTAMTAPF